MNAPATGLGGWRERLLERVERRLPALTRRKAPEPLPVVFDRHRIYVLPTGGGLFFGALLTAMVVGALNYNNNPALILSFLLASAVHTSMLQGYVGLRGLRLASLKSHPVHAGQTLTLTLVFDAVDPRPRRGLVVRRDAARSAFSLPPGASREVRLAIPAPRRGWLAISRMELSTRHPLGLFRIWSWVHPQQRVLVYPAIEETGPPLPRRGSLGKIQRRRGPGEQLHGLRDYRIGDPMRLVAWKRSAQLGQLKVREYETPIGAEVLLDFDSLGGLGREARIRRLARWLLDAEREGLRSTLRVPGQRAIGPGSGPAHLHACLSLLALLPDVGDA